MKKGGDGGVPQIVREERSAVSGGRYGSAAGYEAARRHHAALVAVVNGRGLTMFGYGDLSPFDPIAHSLRPVSPPAFARTPAAQQAPTGTAAVQPTAMSQTGRTAPLWEDYQEALLQAILPTAAPNAICEWVVLGRAEQEVYVWAYCTGYLPRRGRTAASLPAAVTLAGDGRIVTVRVAGDGSLYEPDVRSLFPADVQALILGGTLYGHSGARRACAAKAGLAATPLWRHSKHP